MPKHECKKCNYTTNRLSNWNRHILTDKHLRKRDYVCTNCGKPYKYLSGLSRHNFKCPRNIQSHLDILTNKIDAQDDKISKLLTTIGNTKPSTVNNNVQINLFLNTECKNAMNLNEFIDSLSLSIDDLHYTRDNGHVKGITQIIVKNLNGLNPNERPIHCSNKNKLEFYVKDADKWGPDINNQRIDDSIDSVSQKQGKKIKEWETFHPRWSETDQGIDEYLMMVKEVLGDNNVSKSKKNIKKELGESIHINKLIT